MTDITKKIIQIKATFYDQLAQAKSIDDVTSIKRLFLGRKSSIADLKKELKTLSDAERKNIGPQIQDLQKYISETIERHIADIEQAQTKKKSKKEKYFDVTAYKPRTFTGGLHPYTHITQELEDIFISMGFSIVDGPEVETDYNNFDALNIPADHPARDLHDTFWLDVPGLLMRTHTSTVQSRVMQHQGPPIAVVSPGRVFRHEATDASHDFMFMQCEGVFVDKNVSLSHLFATMKSFLQAVVSNQNIDIRIRPGYFPFVEPGVEIDMSCPFCSQGCSTCKYTQWIEICPGGLIHPNVLRSAGIDPNYYSGFAFGVGLTRLAMLKHGVNDIRLFHSSKLQFLEQFS
jgi:phenylalanyl-tRNA synthetase alpha chain